MGIAVFLMVLASAALHVLWNTLVKTCTDKVSFAWLTTVVGSVATVPPFVLARLLAPGALDARVVGLAALSGVIEAVYLIALFAAYERTDLSVAYPLSRGFAPVAVLVPGVTFLGDSLTLLQSVGLGMIVGGVGGVGASAVLRSPDRTAARRGIILALFSGTMIGGYHLVDRWAMTLKPTAPSMLEYYFLMHTALLAALAVWFTARAGYRRRLWSEWRCNRRGVVVVGVLSVVSYMLIMAALGLREGNVALVTGTRNVGIVISTLVGGLLLKERVDLLRGLGAALIVAGVLVLLLCKG